MDIDGQRLRTWNLIRKETINQCLALSTRIQSLQVHNLSKKDQREEFLIVGLSMNERSLVMFECTLSSDAHSIVLC